ncbi:MAG: CtsR family transcriptional regulator [Clostridiales bacterium]|nr:CtsR family transcriptional regulator [Clostridiales bacterium]
MNISDIIEEFIKSTLGDEEKLQLSRNDLANYFAVAPSQINYVLSTRFNVDKGFVVESKRGGGGSVTIIRISQNAEDIIPNILKEIDKVNELTFNKASDILDRLEFEQIIDASEKEIIKSAISDKALALPMKTDGLRKNIFKEILIGLMRR